MLNVFTLEREQEWDAIVRSFSNYDTYWLSGYVKAFHLHGDGEPLLIYYQDLFARGINVVFRRDISELARFQNKLPEQRYFDLSTPYGYGGWLIEGEGLDQLFAEYQNWCVKNGVISEFVRFHPVIGNHLGMERYYDVIPLGNTVTMDLTSPEVIWANLTSKCRNTIRKAQKNGVCVRSGRCAAIYDTFRGIYNSTMDKDHADPYYYFQQDFYSSIRRDLQDNAIVFYAEYQGIVIAASIMLLANGRMNYHLSGSSKEYAHLAPTNLILFEAAQWGSANGYASLYLGGGLGSHEDSLFHFKKSFYRLDDLYRFVIGKKIFDQAKYDELVAMCEPTDSGFFPKYRA